MPSLADATADPRVGIDGRVYAPFSRTVTGALRVASWLGLLAILCALVFGERPLGLAALAVLLATLVAVPAAAAWLVRRILTVAVTVHHDRLVVERRGFRLEVPCGSIVGVAPWALPLPGPGLSLRLQSGRRLRYGLQIDDPARLAAALAAVGVAAAHAAAAHPLVAWAHARAERPRRRWHHRLGRHVVFPLVPTAVWFNAHQHIAYGGLLGQYYLEGLRPYVTTFGVSWGLAAIYLLLYASVWRAGAEGVVLLAAAVAPAGGAWVRRAAEITLGLLYYGGIPALVLLPFLR